MTNAEAIDILEEVKLLDDSMYQYNSDYLEALDIVLGIAKSRTPEWRDPDDYDQDEADRVADFPYSQTM